VRKIGLSEQTALAVRSLDEHWDGSGYPERSSGEAISPLARVMAVAQHLDVFALERDPEQAMLVLRERSGRWFDPEVAKAAESLHRQGTLWNQCLPSSGRISLQSESQTRSAVLDLAPAQTTRPSAADIDLICEAFSEVVDAKSHFTFSHSIGVTGVASAIGKAMGLKPERRQLLHRAALLHDLGKLLIPNAILHKPGKLDDAEWPIMREHPALSRAILGRVKQFRELAYVVGAHHEKLDGSGYPDRKRAEELSLEARILVVADMYGALTEDRPYRSGYSPEETLRLMESDVPGKIDDDCFTALASVADSIAGNAPVAAPSTKGSERLAPQPLEAKPSMSLAR